MTALKQHPLTQCELMPAEERTGFSHINVLFCFDHDISSLFDSGSNSLHCVVMLHCTHIFMYNSGAMFFNDTLSCQSPKSMGISQNSLLYP